MLSLLKRSPLFARMTEEEISYCLRCSGARAVDYQKGEAVFSMGEQPQKLFILLRGEVIVCRDFADGRRSIITTIAAPGEMFGEVFLFLTNHDYDNAAVVTVDAQILSLPKEYLYHSCEKSCGFHTLLISNMLSILAQKAYFLNQKLGVLSGHTLRQKISRLLLANVDSSGSVTLEMTRDSLAEYLNVARPSLSRELMKMKEEGLLALDGKEIKLLDIEVLQNNL